MLEAVAAADGIVTPESTMNGPHGPPSTGRQRGLPREAYESEDTYRQTRLPVSLATTLIPDAYTSPDFHELELERVFGTSWVAACPTSEVGRPGDAFEFERRDYVLLPVRTETGGCLIFVSLDPDGPPLAEELGDLPKRLAGYRLDEWQVARRNVYEIEANYKLVGENFMEYYHLPWVHPELLKVSPMKAHYRWQGRGMYTGMTTTPIADNAESGGWMGLPPVEGLSESDRVGARFAWVFPNL